MLGESQALTDLFVLSSLLRVKMLTSTFVLGLRLVTMDRTVLVTRVLFYDDKSAIKFTRA